MKTKNKYKLPTKKDLEAEILMLKQRIEILEKKLKKQYEKDTYNNRIYPYNDGFRPTYRG